MFKIENVECELKVNNTSMIQLKAKEAIRTVGCHTCPHSPWDIQFKCMKDKMIDSIEKINNTEIKPYLICLCFNACSLEKVMFWCRLIKLKDYQYKQLRKLH